MRQLPIVLAAGLVTLTGVSQSALAAEASLARMTWTGFYVGINGGGAFGTTDATETGQPRTDVTRSKDFGLNHDANGGIVGGQLGYNWQVDHYLLGIEADLDWADLDGTGRVDGAVVAQNAPDPGGGDGAAPGNFVFAREKLDYLGTVRGRVGMLACPGILVYATGGLAYARIAYTGQFHYSVPTDYIAAGTKTRVGWTLGGGSEVDIGRGWTVRGEYLYYDLGDSSIQSNFAGVPAIFSSRWDFDTHGSIVRVGLNYLFSDHLGLPVP